MKKKIVSISLDTGKVIATRYEELPEESRCRLTALQKICCDKFLKNMREDLITERS